MIGPGIKKYAQTKGWKITKDVAYGYIDGYMVTLVDGWDIKKAAFSCELTDETRAIIDNVLSDKKFRRSYKIKDFYYQVSGIIIVFDDTFFAMKKVAAFLEPFVAILKQYSIPGDGLCTCCGKIIEEGSDSAVILENECAHRAHDDCATMMYKITDYQNNEYNQKKKPLIMGILGAFLGCLIGAVPMAIGSVFSDRYFVLAIFIGICAKIGYELFKGKVGGAKIITVFTFSVVGVAVGIFLSYATNFWFYRPSPDIPPIEIVYAFQYSITRLTPVGVNCLIDFGIASLVSFAGAYIFLKDAHDEDKKDSLVIKIIEQFVNTNKENSK